MSTTATEQAISALENRVADLSSAVADTLDDTNRRMDFLHREMGATQAALRELAGNGVIDEPTSQVSKDRLWICPGCGSRLGVYDPEEDVIRVKNRDSYMAFHAGAGGWLSVSCKGCGRFVDASNEGDGQAAPEPAPGSVG